MRKLLGGAAVAMLFFGARLAWNLISYEPIPEPSAADMAAEAAEMDSWVAEDLAADGAAAPARDWLSADGHMLFEGDPEMVQTLIDDFYAAGAPNVWFIGIEQIGQASVSASIAVELPPDSVTRSQILRTEAKFWHDPESQSEPETTDDVGQRYLVVSFD
jgi:hypothetical protein